MIRVNLNHPGKEKVGGALALQSGSGAVHLPSTQHLQGLGIAIPYTSLEQLVHHLPFHGEIKVGFAKVYDSLIDELRLQCSISFVTSAIAHRP